MSTNGEMNQGSGPLVGSIIVVLVLLLGGYYSVRVVENLNPLATDLNLPVEESTSSQSAQIANIATTTRDKSMDIEDIEKDAMEIDVNVLDSNLENLDLLIDQ